VDRGEAIDGLELDDEGVFDHEVEAVATGDEVATVRDGERHLLGDAESGVFELPGEAGAVGGLEEAGTECTVNGDGGADYFAGEVGSFVCAGGERRGGYGRRIYRRGRRGRRGVS